MCCDVVATTKKVREVTVSFTPTADSGTEANAAFKPLVALVLSGTQFFGAGAGFTEILEVRVRETAGSANKQNALLIQLYDESVSPTAPVIDTAYAASGSGLLTSFKIAAGAAAAATPFQGYRAYAPLISEAIIQPKEKVKNNSETGTGCKVIVLFDASGTVYSVGTDTIEITFTVQDLVNC